MIDVATGIVDMALKKGALLKIKNLDSPIVQMKIKLIWQ